MDVSSQFLAHPFIGLSGVGYIVRLATSSTGRCFGLAPLPTNSAINVPHVLVRALCWVVVCVRLVAPVRGITRIHRPTDGEVLRDLPCPLAVASHLLSLQLFELRAGW